MAKLGAPVQVPTFDGDFMAQYKAEDAWFREWSQDKDVVSFSVADGKALYLVEDDGATLRYIAFNCSDGYTIPDAYVRGLTRDEVRSLVATERAWKAMVAKRVAEKAARV